MRSRRWLFAGLGLGLAVVGGLAEARHVLILGGITAVTGLAAWVLFSGSSFHVHVVTTEQGSLVESCGEVREAPVFPDSRTTSDVQVPPL